MYLGTLHFFNSSLICVIKLPAYRIPTMAAAFRKTCRSLNRYQDNYLEMIARHRFHEGRKENDYEITRRHLKVCEQNCTRLKSTGDLSVCYWILGELASNK